MKVRVDHLTKRYGDTIAVNDISMEIESGSLTVLLGPSGCGKSTMLNMLSGILPVTSGKIYFDDKDVTNLAPDKRNVGLVFQNYALYPHMTVMENICFPLEIKKLPKKARIEKAQELAELVRISDLLNRKPGELSGGQQQRVAIARALAKEPQLLLLDEPLSNLDAKLRVEMREEILRIQRSSMVTTIFVTHDQEEACSIADQVILLKLGVLQQQDTARHLYDEPVNFFAADFLGSPPINKLHGIWEKGQFHFSDSEVSLPLTTEKPVTDGTKVILTIRAESVVLNSEEKPLSGKVIQRYTINKDELSILEIAGQQIRAFIPAEVPLEIGQELSFGLKKKGVFLFNEETGERYV